MVNAAAGAITVCQPSDNIRTSRIYSDQEHESA